MIFEAFLEFLDELLCRGYCWLRTIEVLSLSALISVNLYP
jgi:hypothetical protein